MNYGNNATQQQQQQQQQQQPQPPGQQLNDANDAEMHIHEPFTTAEHLEQLSNIDNDIVSLLQHTSDAMKFIVQAPAATPSETTLTTDAASRFTASQTEFIDTLDRIDKHLRRQIYALEEAGIITLRSSTSDQQPVSQISDGGGGEGGTSAAAAAAAGGGGGGASGGRGGAGKGGPRTNGLIPDGMGRYGGLDVGVLNMAGNTVERDMESELWKNARKLLETVAAKQAQAAANGVDSMQE
ncbi:mediator complex protein-domain-containing protein [Apodospora peruviana]|uniref:Mediator of RNA polymerase II transcription subunit 11 n=1 Tax=Apodospora peruviana TaxID=516989 RepID=A0AAE0IHL3_9PEZI|nr:mediator complex protein-domain-containing protein [Apodospora peruviana]